jgi:hypothetical protein
MFEWLSSGLLPMLKDKLIKMIEDNEGQIEKIFNDNLSKLSPEDQAKFLKSWNLLDKAVKKAIPESSTASTETPPITSPDIAASTTGGKRTRRKGRKQRKHRK